MNPHPSGCRSGTASSCWWATLALVRTTPGLLRHAPPLHPIGEASVAVIRLRRCHTSTATLVGAALAMNPAAPVLLGDTPSSLPIRETILAIVGICRRWRFGWLATDVVNPATPLLLGSIPGEILSHSAIVWINWSGWCRRRHEDWGWQHDRSRWGWRPRRGWGWPRRGRGGRRSGERSRRLCDNRRRQSCRWDSRRRTTSAHGGTAIIFLRLRPHVLNPHTSVPHAGIAHACTATHACTAIVWQ